MQHMRSLEIRGNISKYPNNVTDTFHQLRKKSFNNVIAPLN